MADPKSDNKPETPMPTDRVSRGEEEPEFPVEELKPVATSDPPRGFGFSMHVVDGAMVYNKWKDSTKLTKTAFKKGIENWLKTPVEE